MEAESSSTSKINQASMSTRGPDSTRTFLQDGRTSQKNSRVLEARAEGGAVGSRRKPCPPRPARSCRCSRPPTTPCSMQTTGPGRRLGGASAASDSTRPAPLSESSSTASGSTLTATSCCARRWRRPTDAELRLEIARTELMEAERALTAAHVALEAVPDALPSEPARVAAPRGSTSRTGSPEGVAARRSSARARRLAAATRARDDAIAAEQRAHDLQRGRRGVGRRGGRASRGVGSPRRSEQSLVGACSSDATLAEVSASNGHPSDPAWGDGDTAGAVSNEIDSHLLAWLAARGQHPLADPLPIVLDDAYRELGNEDLDALLSVSITSPTRSMSCT